MLHLRSRANPWPEPAVLAHILYPVCYRLSGILSTLIDKPQMGRTPWKVN
jgi:hypothetical protein